MNCSNCGVESIGNEYAVQSIGKYILLKKAGEQFYKYSFDLYTLCNVNGRTAFKELGKKHKYLIPDMTAIAGDAHAYMFESIPPRSVALCSHRCAVEYAAKTNTFLKRRKDGAAFSPQQSIIEEYCRKNGYADQTLIDEDEWKTIDDEFEGLLKANLPRPHRLLSLASVMIDRGKQNAAERAVESVISEYPIKISAELAGPILLRLNQPERIDALYERLAESEGGRNKLGAGTLSTWAFCIQNHDYPKAVAISSEALESCPDSNLAIENHLGILCDREPEVAIAFFRDQFDHVKRDIGFFAAGKAFLRIGILDAAEENLRLAELLVPDPMSKAYLAETLYRLQRYAEALDLCSEGEGQLNSFEIRAATDWDGLSRNPSHYPYEQKKALRKGFLAVEGKSLIAIGEIDSGKKRVQDAIDLNLGFESKDVFFDDIQEIAGEYIPRLQIQQSLIQEQRRVADILSQKKKTELKVDRLSDIIVALAASQKEWHDGLLKLKHAADDDLLSEHFVSEIHAFCMLITKHDQYRYQTQREFLNKRFAALPERVIEQLANAEFLLDNHNQDELPIFAGAIIERSKAVETAVNEILIRPFILSVVGDSTQKTLEVKTPNGRSRFIEVIYRGNVKAMMLGDMFVFLQARSAEWKSFCENTLRVKSSWILNELPNIIKTVKDEYRNGSAHYNSADRQKAISFRVYLENKHVFAALDEIAEASVA